MIKSGGTKSKPASARHKACGCESHSVTAEITALLNTLRELAAIRSTAEDAAARILDSAEGLLSFADKEEAEKAEEAILSIMTACGFHDLVGQRVTKITETLDRVIARRLNDDEPTRSAPQSEIALEGPALAGTAHDQARIDALFSDKN
jgi:chemotaxis regulatin CheY-phosphate phosphatase CheZ